MILTSLHMKVGDKLKLLPSTPFGDHIHIYNYSQKVQHSGKRWHQSPSMTVLGLNKKIFKFYLLRLYSTSAEGL